MNEEETLIETKQIDWKDSLILWIALFIVQLFVFTSIIASIYQLTGWNWLINFGITGNIIGTWLGVLLTELGTLLISIFYLRITNKYNFNFTDQFSIEELRENNIFLALIFVPIIFFVGIIISYIQSFFFYNPAEQFIYNTIYSPKNIFELIIWIVIMLFLVGPVEEIVFRGIIQQGFQNTLIGTQKWISIIIGSLLFSIYHIDLSNLIPIFFMGLFLGFLYYRTKSTIICAISHGLYNAVSIFIIFIIV